MRGVINGILISWAGYFMVACTVLTMRGGA